MKCSEFPDNVDAGTGVVTCDHVIDDKCCTDCGHKYRELYCTTPPSGTEKKKQWQRIQIYRKELMCEVGGDPCGMEWVNRQLRVEEAPSPEERSKNFTDFLLMNPLDTNNSAYRYLKMYSETAYGSVIIKNIVSEYQAGDEWDLPPFSVYLKHEESAAASLGAITLPFSFPLKDKYCGGEIIDPLAVIHHEFGHTKYGQYPNGMEDNPLLKSPTDERGAVLYYENPARVYNLCHEIYNSQNLHKYGITNSAYGEEPRYTYWPAKDINNQNLTVNIICEHAKPGQHTYEKNDPRILRPICNSSIEEGWSITLIPRIMRKNKWYIGAQLMEYWFSREAYTYPNPEDLNHPHIPYNDKIITLKWVLTYSRAKKIYDAMWNDKIYANDAAQELIEEMLRKNKKFDKLEIKNFGDLSPSVSVADINAGDFYIQQRVLENSWFQDLDGLVAALANFGFRMAVQGQVAYKETRKKFFGLGSDEDVYIIKINKVGIYIRDSYDFIGSQLGGLGYWNPDTNQVSTSSSDGSHKVKNSTFRDWREASGCGGDFIVFSDVEVRPVDESWEIAI